MVEGDSARSAHLVRFPHEAGEGVGSHFGGTTVHVETDGVRLGWGETEVADTPEDADRTASVSREAVSEGTAGGTYIVEERPEDNALAGEVAAMGEGVAAGFEGVLGETASPAVVRVAAAGEKVTTEEVVDGGRDTFTASLTEEGENLGLDFAMGHKKLLLIICTEEQSNHYSRRELYRGELSWSRRGFML